jgi:hypothetical protein
MRRRIDPKRAEEVLLSQEDVRDASVWIHSGRLRAHVILHDGARLTPDGLQAIVQRDLDDAHTPYEFTFGS